MTTNITRPSVAKRPFSRLSDGIKHPVTTTNVNVVLAQLQARDLAQRDSILASLPEYGIDSPLTDGPWVEVAMSGCAFGCKVMRKGARLVIDHYSGYGCNVTQADIEAGMQHLLDEEPLAEWERVLHGEIIRTDEGHGEERAVSAWEREFLGVNA